MLAYFRAGESKYGTGVGSAKVKATRDEGAKISEELVSCFRHQLGVVLEC